MNIEIINKTAIICYILLVAVYRELRNTFALKQILAIFDNDAHNIVSKKGWEILNETKK